METALGSGRQARLNAPVSDLQRRVEASHSLLQRLPIIIINFKTYEEATGDRALRLARICRSVAMKYGKRITISRSSPTSTGSRESSAYIPVFAQHIDDGIGKFTGSISPLAVREAGAVGTLATTPSGGRPSTRSGTGSRPRRPTA